MKLKRLLCMLLSILMIVTCAGGCGNGAGGGDNSDKSELRVGNLLSGFGEKWLLSLKTEFEEMYKNHEFEEGKRGVVVSIDNQDQAFSETALLGNMDRYENDIYYVNDIYNQKSFITNGLSYDTTAWVTEKVYDENGDLASQTGLKATTSIIDTMYDGWADKFNFGTKENPAFYGMPWRLAFGGIIYDADLFATKGFFLNKDGDFELGLFLNDDDPAHLHYDPTRNATNAGKGPDGLPGTSDDGMPSTWGEFKLLMSEMFGSNVTPFIWSGSLTYQRKSAFQQIIANYEGYEDFLLNFTFDGEDSDHPEWGEINEDNAYLLRGQEGKKAAIQAFYDIVTNPNYYTASSFGGSQHKEAEKEYIESITTSNPIAMLMEGGWWEQESREYADALGDFNPNLGYGKRNFKLLPIPKFVGVNGIKNQENTERVLYGTESMTLEMVWAKSQKLDIVKEWLQFVHSRDGLAIFVRDTSSFRPYNFTAKDKYFNEFTSFTKSIYTYIDEGARLVSDLNFSKIRQDNANEFVEFMSKFRGTNGTEYFEVASAFRANPTWTVEGVFEMFKNTIFTESSWNYTK